MSIFREEHESASNVETIKNGCPICHSDVKGNDEYLYFCANCSILYRKSDLVLDKKVVEDLVKVKIAEKFEKDKDRLKVEEEPIKEKELSEKKIIILKDLRTAKKYYISRKSNILHMSNCPYGKNIKKENKIVLRTLEGTEKLKKCRCMSD